MNETKDIARRIIDGFNRRDLDAALAEVAEGLVNHAAIPQAQGRAGMRAIMEKVLKAFPDAKHTIEDLVAEGDRVVCRVTVAGTHTGPLEFTRLPVPPTGRSVRTTIIHIFRIEAGKVVEHWGCKDDLGLMRQLGLSNPSSAAA